MIEVFNGRKKYRTNETVAEIVDGCQKIYISLHGDYPESLNVGNLPSVSPSSWSLLEIKDV